VDHPANPEPATNGQLIYSKGLIEAVCRGGASLTVIGLSRPENPLPSADPRGIDWRLADEGRSLPGAGCCRPIRAAQRGSPAMEQTLERALAGRAWMRWCSTSCSGWALGPRSAPSRPWRAARIIYIAHNHEVTVARRITASAEGLRRIQRAIDRKRPLSAG
jgi:hypothetical protein